MVGKLLQERPLFIKTALQRNSDERQLDRLDLLPYAEALSDFIETSATPMTVGLQGDWQSNDELHAMLVAEPRCRWM